MDVKGALTKKYAGVPGFILAGVAGLGIFLFVKMRGASSSTTAASSSGTTPGFTGDTGATGDPGQAGPAGPAGPAPKPAGLWAGLKLNSYGVPPAVWAKWTEHQKELWKLHHTIPAGAAVGGPASVGSRSATLMHYAHPLLTRRVVYSHFVRAVGGPAAHKAEVHRVAGQAGVHPARLEALNPVYTGKIRIA